MNTLSRINAVFNQILCDFSAFQVVNRKILCNFAVFLGTKDIAGSTLPITTSEKWSQSVTRASAHYAQAFRRLQRLVVSRECVEMACALSYE